MTDVTESRDQAGAELSAADEQLLRELTERARTGGLKLTGEGGLLGRLTKMVIEGALEGELDDHLGYGKHDPEGRDGGNSRNGRRAKTVLTDTGPVEISVPRDRDSSFEPKIVAKRQRRLTGVDEMVISLSAKGLTHGEISAHLAEVYGAEVSKQTITAITDRVMEGLADWQSRPLDPVYAVLFIDAINVKIRVLSLILWSAGQESPGGPGESHPRAPTERSVTVSRHSARLIPDLVRIRSSRPSGRTCVAAVRSARATTSWLS
jgi:putative transposase